MRCQRGLLVVLMLAVAVFCQQPVCAQRLFERGIQRFDTDGDGRLSPSERQAIRHFFAQRRAGATEEDAKQMTWQVEGQQRQALVFLPSKPVDAPLPVVFAFHGHGGSALNAARSFALHKYWPEALVVYMQGLPTPGRLTDPEGKRNGWQHDAGDQNDRDLKFFDIVLNDVQKQFTIDAGRIYATGHSNGGSFTYLLWAERPNVFAAVAPSAATSRAIRRLRPKPAMHIAGKNDSLVLFAWQQRAMDSVREINGCSKTGEPWAKDCTLYPSSSGTPFVAFVHDGTHRYPAEAPPLIVKFFKEQHQ